MNDWSVKNVWPLIKNNLLVCQYLPSEEMNEGRFPDKIFFWGVVFTVIPEWADDYYEKVVAKRLEQKKAQELFKPKQITIASKWREALEQHAFESKGK